MVERAKQDSFLERPGEQTGGTVPGSAVSEPPFYPEPRADSTSSFNGSRAEDVIGSTRREALKIRERAQRRTGAVYAQVNQKARDLGQQARFATRYLRHEYPVELLGVLAGAAFLAGVALRIWRSRS